MRGLIKVGLRLAIFVGMWAVVQAGVKTLTAKHKHLGGYRDRPVAVQLENPLANIKQMVAGNTSQAAKPPVVTGGGVIWGEAAGSSENYYKDYPGRK